MFDYSQSEEANLRLALIEANKERDAMSSLYDESLGDLQVAMALEKNRRAERDALQARLDEAVELLREASDVINLPWHDARRAFLSRINADGGVK